MVLGCMGGEEWGANYVAEEDARRGRRAFLEFVECNLTNVADLLLFFLPPFPPPFFIFFKVPQIVGGEHA